MPRIIRPGERTFTVSALAITGEPDPRVLLMAHAKLGCWLPPGGHIEWDEDPITALVREFDEEVGVLLAAYLPRNEQIGHVTVLPLPAYLLEIRVPADKPNVGDPEHCFIDLMYVVRIPWTPVREGVRAEWVSMGQLAFYSMPENIRRFIKEQMRRGP